MTILEYKSNKEKINEIGKALIIAGAGISVDPPSALPKGEELMEYYIDTAIGREYRETLYSKWESISGFAQDTKWCVESIRLEFIISQIDEIDRELDKPRLISGFEGFDLVNSNENHKILYRLLDKGYVVLTPNFDSLIEKSSDLNYQDNLCYGVHTICTDHGKKVYHYHGVANEYDDMGATLSNIKKGLPKEFKEMIISCFENGYSLLMLGFSCSDFFDITPFFDKLSYDMKKQKRKFSGKAIFFDHNSKEEYDCKNILKNKIERHCNMFSSYEIWHGDTNLFLKDILGEKVEQCNFCNTGEWFDIFEKLSKKITIEQKVLYVVKILNNIGMNFESQWFEKNHFLEKYKNKYVFLDYAASIMLKKDIPQHIRKKFVYDKNKSVLTDIKNLYEKNEYYSRNYRILCRQYNKIPAGMEVQKSAKRMKYNNFVRHISKSPISSEAFSSSYVNAFLRLVKREICKWIICKKGDRGYERLLLLYKCGRKMQKLHFTQYMYMSYYNTIIYGNNLLQEMLFHNSSIEKSEKKIITLFLEMSSVGMLPLLFIQSAKLYVIRYIYTGNEEYKAKARIKIINATKINEQLENKEVIKKTRIIQNLIENMDYSKFGHEQKIIKLLYL